MNVLVVMPTNAQQWKAPDRDADALTLRRHLIEQGTQSEHSNPPDTSASWSLEGRSSLRIGVGTQTIQGPLSQRWSSMFGYQYKISRRLAVPFELQLYRNERTGTKTLYFLSAELKAYLPISRVWNLYVKGGPQVGALLFGISLHYSVGTEVLLNRQLSLFVNWKRTDLRPDLDDFLLVGVVFTLGVP